MVTIPAMLMLSLVVSGARLPAERPAAAPPALANAAPAARAPIPSLGCWFWSESEFQPGGYRPFLDLVGRHAPYELLTTSLRVPRREVTERAVHDQIREAAAYARRYGLGVVMDLDVRLAREAFRRAYPDELQEMLRLREVELSATHDVALTVTAEVPGDHYTFGTTPYVPVAGRLVRVYALRRADGETDPLTIRDISKACAVAEAAANRMRVVIRKDAAPDATHAVVAVAFAHLTPDVFAPHLIPFQRQILRQYADIPLAGACKDEWGFPPCFDGCPAKNDFWFSRSHAKAYARRTAGRDLVRDCLLMWRAEQGRDRERQAAINHYQQLAWQRNAALEADFYRTVKSMFGRSAVVATHPTWWPNPDVREFKKNGLDWWAAPRDWAQTDEVTPFPVRTALAKKWGSPVWFNMFYAPTVPEYETALWNHALGGGRLNIHPLYPTTNVLRLDNTAALLRGDLMRADARIRLLNWIVRAPLECPVAVIFGHAAAMNWAGPHYDDVGLGLAHALWRRGYPADLIPADEIQSGALRVDRAGYVRYGAQRYAAAVVYHPEFEPRATAAFVARAARSRTALWQVGEWTRDFEARPGVLDLWKSGATGQVRSLPFPTRLPAFEDSTLARRDMRGGEGRQGLHEPEDPTGSEGRLARRDSWPAGIRQCPATDAGADPIVDHLRSLGIPPQTPATERMGWDRPGAAPPRTGTCRLLDGTVIWLAGTRQLTGDPIAVEETVSGKPVRATATGVLAIRFDAAGRIDALALGGATRFQGGDLDLEFDRPIDFALWCDASGQRRGVILDWDGPLPAALLTITSHWTRVSTPPGLSRGRIEPIIPGCGSLRDPS
ncbi:MAG TPA: hypothetical protein PKJ98_08990 [Verrucomicrobiota bacterium]|nr:hypothetical protein [Verrucomicrobiota bacterium]